MAETLDEILRSQRFDSRQIIDRIEELENANTDDNGVTAFLDEDEKDEYDQLKTIENDCEGYAPDWQYGTTFISDGAFVDYAEEVAQDIGAIDSDFGWPLGYIDWEAAADALKMDYTSVTIDGEDWWYR